MSGTGGCVQSVFCVSAHTCMRQCLHMTELLDLPETKQFALAKDPRFEKRKKQKNKKRKVLSFPHFVNSFTLFILNFNSRHSEFKDLLSLSADESSLSLSISIQF